VNKISNFFYATSNGLLVGYLNKEKKNEGFLHYSKKYRENPSEFSIQYKRKDLIRISWDIENDIFKELCINNLLSHPRIKNNA